MPKPDDPPLRLLERFDPTVFDVGERTARLRIEGAGPPRLVVLEDSRARIEPADDRRPDAVWGAAWRSSSA